MHDDFLKPYNPHEIEQELYAQWEASGFFNPDHLPVSKIKNLKSKIKNFSIVLPPPNVTGNLHMGHALNTAIQDVLIRYKRMKGYKTLWIPGTDHAGIATQNVVEKKLKKEGISRHDLGKEKFLEKVWEWKEQYGNIILDQLKRIGASCDWSRTRFTMDEEYAKAVKEAFTRYYEKGWIYQGDRIVNWCPRCGTSLSDLELEYREQEGILWHIAYPIKDSDAHIVVATTRPETMLGDTAVAVHPDDARYKKLVGRTVVVPIIGREIPVIADQGVEKDFGTGAVKVTPAHDFADSQMGERHNLPIVQVINERGKMTPEAGKAFVEMKVARAREAVVEKLKELGALEKAEPYTHSVAHCYRCDTVIEPLISKQWFVKMDELAKMALEAVERGEVKFHPQRWEKLYRDWLSNIRDWCISRQIWWGHQLPVWFCKKQIETFSEENKNLKFKIKNSSVESPIISEERPDKCPLCGECEMEQATDVLDTWFSSALWPFATLGWPEKTDDLKEFYPTTVLSTARDIINLWVSRMVFSGMELIGKKPFSDVIIHATILAKDGRRMSKSLGTGIDPMTLIEQHGADATRFGLLWQAMGGQDIKWADEHVLAGKKFANKLWNITRFVLTKTQGNGQQFVNDDPQLLGENREIVERFKEIKKQTEEKIESYEFGQALHDIYEFVWHEFADKFIEYSKDKDDEETNQALLYVLYGSIKLLHPFMPFVTEAIYQRLPEKDKEFLMVEEW